VSDPIEIYGSGEQIRDFTYIDDVVEANLLAATVDTKPGSVYNVAGGSSVTVNQVIDHIQRISGNKLDVRYVDGVPGDVSRTGGSTLAIRRDLGWSASVSIEEGLRRHFEWGVEHFARGNEDGATNPSDFVG
jgi:nucleoside-diphosphate-sugar epimerase